MNPCDVCFMCDDPDMCLNFGECVIEAEEDDVSEWIIDDEDVDDDS